MSNEISRREFLKQSLATLGVILTSELAKWIEALPDEEFQSLLAIATKFLTKEQILGIFDENLDHDEALGTIYGNLLQNGEDPEEFLITQGVLQRSNALETSLTKKETLPVIPPDETIYGVKHLSTEDKMALESSEITPYNPSIFDVEKINKTTFKLKIYLKLLFPELQERFQHVTVDTIELDIFLLNLLSEEKRRRILRTIQKWEKDNGFLVRYTGVLGIEEET